MSEEECVRPNIYRSDYRWMQQFGEGEGKSPKGSLMRKVRAHTEAIEARVKELEAKVKGRDATIEELEDQISGL